MDLYILRHGEAGKRIAAGSKDSERALTVVGKQQVEQIADALALLGIKPDLVGTSPLPRSYQTAAIVAKKLKIKKDKVEEWDELKPEGSRIRLYERLARVKPEVSLMVVGHEPYLSSLVSELAFDGQKGRIAIKKAGLVRISIISLNPRPKGEIRWLLTPRIMKRIAS